MSGKFFRRPSSFSPLKMTIIWNRWLCIIVLISICNAAISEQESATADVFTNFITDHGNDEFSAFAETLTSQPGTDKSASLSPKPSTSYFPPYPRPVLAEVTSRNAVKKIQNEVAISRNSSYGCKPSNISSCEALKEKVLTEFGKHYRQIQGYWYTNLEIIESRYDKLIIRHEVSYTYNDMIPEDRGLSPQVVYDRTIGPAVLMGMVGEFKVLPCSRCNQTTDLTNLCDLVSYCDAYLWVKCIEGYLYCVSPCQNKSTCYNGAPCFQKKGSEVECKCDNTDRYYIDDRCQPQASPIAYAIIFALISISIFPLLCCIWMKRRTRRKQRSNQLNMEGIDNGKGKDIETD